MEENSFISTLISVVLSLLAGIGGAAWKISSINSTVSSLKEKSTEHDSEIKKMLKTLTQCETRIEERTKSYASTLTKSESPVTLTDAGNALLKRSGADLFILENQKELVGQIRESSPKTAYDVQVMAKSVIKGISDDDKFNKFKDFVYKEGIDLEPIFIVMSLFLRDIALPLLGFKPEDIDKHDPKQKP